MTVNDQIKILDRQIKQNKSQYDLDRKAAKISALFSGNLGKYEYFTDEDLNYRQSTAKFAKCNNSPLSIFLNKGLKEEGKKEGLSKGLKNIEDKNEEQLKTIKNKNKVFNNQSFDLEKAYNEIEEINEKIDNKRSVFVGSGKHRYNFSNFLNPKDFFDRIFNGDISLKDAIDKQMLLEEKIRELDYYSPIKRKYKIREKILFLM